MSSRFKVMFMEVFIIIGKVCFEYFMAVSEQLAIKLIKISLVFD